MQVRTQPRTPSSTSQEEFHSKAVLPGSLSHPECRFDANAAASLHRCRDSEWRVYHRGGGAAWDVKSSMFQNNVLIVSPLPPKPVISS